MTVQEAKDILAQNLWKRYPVWDIFIGDLVEETFDDDKDFPDCYIINVALADKGKQPVKRDWGECFVSKIDRHCGPAIAVKNTA